MSYAICRLQKCGSSHDIAGAQIHDRRERNHSNTNPDIDFERSKDNYSLCNRSAGKTFNAVVDEIIEKEYTSSRTIRKDAVKMCEVLFTSDTDFFTNKSSSEQRTFFEDCYRWAAERWGESRIVAATVHLDEQTPHMHLCFVPLAESIDKKTGEIVTTLNAHKAVGSGSKAFQQLQDDFYKAVGKAYGLERGNRSDLENGEQPRKNQRVEEYKNTTQYYQRQKNALETNVQALQGALNEKAEKLSTAEKRLSQLNSELSESELKAIDVTPKRITGGFKGLSPEQAQQLYNTAVSLKKENKELTKKLKTVSAERDQAAERARKSEEQVKYVRSSVTREYAAQLAESSNQNRILKKALNIPETAKYDELQQKLQQQGLLKPKQQQKEK